MRYLYAVAAATLLFAACSESGTDPTAPTAPTFPGIRGYNEVSSGSGWVRAELDDYPPGVVVTILGGGWEPGETVIMIMSDEPDVQQDLVLTAVADANGNFANTDFSTTDIHLGVTFTVAAEGQTSGMTASTMFDDGNVTAATTPTLHASNCTTSESSFDLGEEVCAKTTITVQTPPAGPGVFRFQWLGPAPSTTVAQTTTDSGGNSSTHEDKFTPTSAGTWTVRICKPTGNCASGGNLLSSSTFDVNAAPTDTEAPVLSCTVPDQGTWYNDNVTVNCTASDASGLQVPSDAAFSLSTSVGAGTEIANAQTGSKEVCDIHDNCATAGPYTFMVDLKDPSISCGAADGVWHASDVSIACTASDGGSGLADVDDASFSLSTSVAAGTEDGDASTDSKTVYDAAGNSATAGPIGGNMVDKKKPTVTCGSADTDWHPDDVHIACTASDGGSGLAVPGDASFSLSTDVPAGTETDDASTGTKNICDDVGNCETAGPISGNKVDKKGPVVTLACPATPVILGSIASANWTATDGGSGVAIGFGSGSIDLDTSSVGAKVGTVPANASRDEVNNGSGVATCNYSVIFDWSGFFSPVDNPPMWNTAKAGSAIPIKFSLAGNQGLSIFASNSPSSQKVACDASAAYDPIEDTVTAGNSTLSYDSVEDQYVYVWKTDKSWGNTCRQLTVKLTDGTTHQANFKFSK